ncbi:prostate and testis expressed protein 2 isoform X5 [Suricata suricatta]|uniref:prostate and testis expressed protein 2 isoform X5 n=1 Tax=Suricata suricatta TaxID=37032 RepID=UPI0011569BD6|nr:prostate and testis expressed protein 2 isoform X5 [Suricata suricatta]
MTVPALPLFCIFVLYRPSVDWIESTLTCEGIRVCYHCDHFDGYKCLTHLKRCWKFNLMAYNRTCTTDHYYYSDRITGRHLYRYSKLSCSPCEEGMVQEFHDLVRETFCCNHADLCNNGNINMDTTLKFGKEVDKMT